MSINQNDRTNECIVAAVQGMGHTSPDTGANDLHAVTAKKNTRKIPALFLKGGIYNGE